MHYYFYLLNIDVFLKQIVFQMLISRYLLPMVVACLSYILSWLADFTCSGWSQTCAASSELFSHIYMVVFFFLVIVASTKAKQISDLVDRVKAAYRMLTAAPAKAKHD